jgi:hypothetical protein
LEEVTRGAGLMEFLILEWEFFEIGLPELPATDLEPCGTFLTVSLVFSLGVTILLRILFPMIS